MHLRTHIYNYAKCGIADSQGWFARLFAFAGNRFFNVHVRTYILNSGHFTTFQP